MFHLATLMRLAIVMWLLSSTILPDRKKKNEWNLGNKCVFRFYTLQMLGSAPVLMRHLLRKKLTRNLMWGPKSIQADI